MAGAMRKMAVYLGLFEDDEEPYDDYADYNEEPARHEPVDRAPERAPAPRRGAREAELAAVAGGGAAGGVAAGRGRLGVSHAPEPVVTSWSEEPVEQPAHRDSYRITTLHPRTYNDARAIGEHFRTGTPVIMNLTDMDDSDAKRLVDFAAGLIFGLHGSIDRITNKVFLLSPRDVEVTAEEKRQLAEGAFFNQS